MFPLIYVIELLLVVVVVILTIKFRKLLDSHRQLKDRFTALQRLSNTGYFENQNNEREIFWSEQLNTIFGLEAGKSIRTKESAYSLIHPEDRDDYIKQLEKNLSERRPFQYDYRIINPKSKEIEYLRTNAEIIFDTDNKSLGIRGVVRNLTKKKKIEKDLELSVKQQQSILSNIDDLVFIVDIDGIFREYHNSADIKLLITPEEFLGKHYRHTLPDFIYKKLQKAIDDIESGENSAQFEYYLEESKIISTYNVRVSKLKNILNGTDDYLILIRDVSKYKSIETELQKSEMRFQELTELLPVAVFEVDTDLVIRYVNKKGFEWFGYEESDLENSINATSIVSEEDKPKLLHNLAKRLGFEDFGPVEYKARRKNGELFDVLIYASPMLNANMISGVRGVLMDITERKKYISELEKFSKFDALGILAGGIAHNFKNILAAVTLSVDMIKLKPESLDKQIERISRSLEQANALASRFQTFTKSNEPNWEVVNINQLLEEGIEIAFAGTSCAVETKFNAQTNSTMGDSKQLNEVFLNLFINAHQATSDGGIIKIITTNEFVRDNKIANLHEGNYIKITVSDNGVGITEAQLDKLFTPFYTTKQHGNGLGLVTVFSIVNAHAGSVQVESKVGIGTQFHVYLPIRDEIRSMNNTGTIDNLDNSKEYKVKVILVDDDKNITEMMTELSKEIDRIELKTFNDPDMAIQYFRMKSTVDPFEVAILDMTLVGFDKSGVDVLNILKEIDPAIKAIIFTGHSSKPIVSNYRDYGFDGKLEKPCNFEQLLDKVNDVFTGRTK